MKKVFTMALAMVLLSTGAYAQNDAISKLFAQYWEDEDFTTVHLTRRMFEIVAEIPVEEDEEEVLSVIRTLDGMRMIATERDGRRMYDDALVTLKGSAYEELMVVRDGEQHLQFMVMEDGNGKIRELVLVGIEDEDDDDGQFFLMTLTGDIDLKQIAKLSSTLEIDGMQELENLEDHDE